MINRNFTDKSQSTLIPLYKSLVRTHLEYCCSVWNQHFRKDIELIEEAVADTEGSQGGHGPPRSPHPNFAVAKVCRIQGWKT